MTAPKSILVCCFSHNVWGGIETWLREILSAHREAGWDVTLALARGKRFNDPKRFLKIFGESSALELDGRIATQEGRIVAVQRAVQRVAPSIVLPLGLGHALPAIGRAKLAGTRCRLVHALHAINAPLLRDAEAFAPVTDLIVGVNPLQIEYLRRTCPDERLAVVPNGTRIPDAARVPRIAGRPLRLVFAGRIDQDAKRVLDIVELSLELRRRGVEFHYTVAGDGPSLGVLRAAIAENGLDDRIETPGYVDPMRLYDEIYPASDIVTVFSEVGESFVLVAIDAMIHGCVLVTSEWPGVHSAGYLREPETGFAFPPGAIQRAADSIERLFRDRGQLESMSRNAAGAARRFTWARTRTLWLAAMERLLEREPVVDDSFPSSHKSGSGRLDRLPGGIADRLRHLLRRFPDFADGWGEWPGTLSAVTPDEERALRAELRQLDAV